MRSYGQFCAVAKALDLIGDRWALLVVRELLVKGPSRGDAFQSHWLTLPLRLHLRDGRPEEPPVTVELRTGEEPLLVRAGGGAVTVTTGQADDPDAVLAGPPRRPWPAHLRPDPAAAGVRKRSTP
jgi:hypothetical protein